LPTKKPGAERRRVFYSRVCKARFSTRANKKPAHRAAMPGFFDASPAQERRSQSWLREARFSAFLVKNPHIAQRCRVSLMPPRPRNGEANPGRSSLQHYSIKKPAHRAAMPGFSDTSPPRNGEAKNRLLVTT